MYDSLTILPISYPLYSLGVQGLAIARVEEKKDGALLLGQLVAGLQEM